MIAWRDKKKRVKMMMKKSVACAKIKVSVAKEDRLKNKFFKAENEDCEKI